MVVEKNVKRLSVKKNCANVKGRYIVIIFVLEAKHNLVNQMVAEWLAYSFLLLRVGLLTLPSANRRE